MYAYLEGLYRVTNDDYLGSLLGDMSLLEDGSTADSAVWIEWLEAVEKVRRKQVDAGLHLSD